MRNKIKHLLAIILVVAIISTFSSVLVSAEDGMQWEGSGITSYGRNGVKLNSGKAVATAITSIPTFDMNAGITIKFKVTSIPGLQGDVDAWIGFMLHMGKSDNPEFGGTGFKFLLRDTNPKSGATGTAVQRFIRVPGTPDTERSKAMSPLATKVPLLNNDHYITIMEGNEGGFLVNIDGEIVNYFEDTDAYKIADLKTASVVVRAYTSAVDIAKDVNPWEVIIDEIKPITKTEKWNNLGTSNLEEKDGKLSVVENLGKGGANQTLLYNQSIDVSKTTNLSINLNQVPNYSDDMKESYVAILFSSAQGVTDINDSKTMLCLFKVRNRSTLIGNFGLGSMVAGLDKEVKGLKPMSEIKVKFGFNEDKIAVLTVNDVVVGHSKNLKLNHFLDKKGYISIVTANLNAEENAPNWAYSISKISSTDDVMPKELEQKPVKPEEPAKKGCGSVYFGGNGTMGTGIGLVTLVTLLAVFVVALKKARKESNI